jgi:hypothetical protein
VNAPHTPPYTPLHTPHATLPNPQQTNNHTSSSYKKNNNQNIYLPKETDKARAATSMVEAVRRRAATPGMPPFVM